ncbi:non-ribosomal peptide synthetase [Xanthomonas arboricola]|uniref:non-ribosomal peptide synthetase n=1 Tax=Xanthomonas arboricola TaxID=56448 RepID=UPI0018AFACCD|nr:non-ribosomal peptide synthetase [Xanthomonas arboricola]
MQDDVIEGFRLSPQQRHLWLAGGGRTDVCQCAISIAGPLTQARLQQALSTLTARHEVLRTQFQTFPGMDVPVQVPGAVAQSRLSVLTLAHDAVPAEAIEMQLEADARPDAAGGNQVRYTWLATADDTGTLLVTVPSLCADSASLFNLYAQLADLCLDERDAAGDGDVVQYADYSEWQNETVEAGTSATGGPYWEGFDVDAGVPGALRRDDAQTGGAIPSFRLGTLPAAVVERMRAFARTQEVEPSTVVLAALSVLLWRTGDGQVPVLAVPVEGRAMDGLGAALGLFEKPLPFALRIEEDYSFADVVRRTRDQLAQAAAAHGHYLPGSAARPEIAFGWVAYPAARERGALRLKLTHLRGRAAAPVFSLTGLQTDAEVTLRLDYDARRYPEEAADRLMERLPVLLDALLDAPQRNVLLADLMPAGERRRVLVEWNQTERTYPRGITLHTLFHDQVQRSPHATAVICDEQSLSFLTLDGLSQSVAQRVIALRSPGAPAPAIGVCLDRSCWMLVAILGIWKAGCAYVPIDPSLPPARRALLAREAGCAAVLTQQRLFEALSDLPCPLFALDVPGSLDDGEPVNAELPACAPDSLAYILYTSGSTGTPNGVMVEHGAAVNLAFALHEAIYQQMGRALTIALNAPLMFDASVKQLIQVINGHCVCIVTEQVRRDPGELCAYLRQHRVDAMDCTPSQLALWQVAGLPATLEGLPSIILVGGEAVDGSLWRVLANAPGKRCYNLYGPTECTVDATIARIEGPRPTIGRPLPNVRVYVLDDAMNPVPTGTVGELYVGGDGVARGYLNRPELTALRFVADPFHHSAGCRMYRTGDKVRQFPDGNLQYLHRVDHQVKIQGTRIELPEIEQVLREHPGVREAVVVVATGEVEQLAGHVLPHPHYRRKIEGNRRFVLPDGRAIVQRNRNESEYLYLEIVERLTYLRNGITLPEDAVVFDVGANIGMFSMLVAERCPHGAVYAFEPLPPIFALCRINAELYAPHTRLFPFGLSGCQETATFTYYPHYSMMSGREAYSDANSDMEVIKRYLANQKDAEAEGSSQLYEHADSLLPGRFIAEHHACTLRRLSDVIAEQQVTHIDLLKIDVQRAELDVLEGIDDAHWPLIQQVVMEIHDGEGTESAGRTGVVARLLERHGFQTLIEQEGELIGTDRFNFYASRLGLRPGAVADPAPAARLAIGPHVLTTQELREHLKAHLPGYMVPASLVLLEEMPLTRNGKVDRNGLANAGVCAGDLDETQQLPQSQLERQIAAVWQEVLGLERVGLRDNFFDIGGHSLLLIQLHRRLCEELGVELLILDVFQNPNVAALAEHVQRKQKGTEETPAFEGARDRASRMKAANEQRRRPNPAPATRSEA